MTAPSVLSAANARLEYLLLSDGAPARCDGDLRNEVVKFHSELVYLENLLRDEPSYFRKQVIRLAYYIEDAVDSYSRVKSCGCLSKLFSERRLRADLGIFRGKIKELGRLAGERRDVAAGGVSSSSTGSTSGLTFDGTARSSVPDGSAVVVGIEEERQLLLDLLVSRDHSVIAILGLGGSGKTTLARKVYNDPLVTQHFDMRVWVCVSQDYRPRKLLEEMLFLFRGGSVRQNISKMETTELMEQLYKVQKGKRCLVVLDDVWSLDPWNTVRLVLPEEDNGSKVIITSRIQASAPPSSYIHRKLPLSDEQSWALMEKKLQLPDTLDIEVKMNLRRIIERCHGLPLALTVMSNVLKGKTFDDWKVVLESLEQPQNSNDSFQKTFGLSYDALPTRLKPCFVYLGHFPSDHTIPIDKLYLLWMAEGLILTKGVGNLSKFDIAEEYFKVLVDRSMVMVQKEEELASQWPKSCQIHDLLRDLCIAKGNEDEFFEVVDSECLKETSFTSYRLAIHLNKHENLARVSLKIPEAKTVRSLLLYETEQNSKWPSEIADLKKFRYLRVLDINGVNFLVQKLPKNIDKLAYLRYLSFRGCHIMEFPSSFSNFPFLETLDLRVIETCRIIIPNVLRKLKSLRCLYLPVVFQIGRNTQDDKLRLDGLTRLELLENFNASLCDVDDLQQLQKVHVFSGVVDGNNEDLEKIINFLNENLRSSRQTSLVVKKFDSYSERRFSILKNLLRCRALHALEIEGFLGELRRLEGISLTSNFTEMVFSGSEFGQDPMQILGKLPKLRSLVLCEDAFVGKSLECSEADFPVLTSLKLAMLQSLETWNVGSRAMPNLTVLTIEQCEELQTLPDELMEKQNLKEIKIGSMPQKFQENVSQMAGFVLPRIIQYNC